MGLASHSEKGPYVWNHVLHIWPPAMHNILRADTGLVHIPDILLCPVYLRTSWTCWWYLQTWLDARHIWTSWASSLYLVCKLPSSDVLACQEDQIVQGHGDDEQLWDVTSQNLYQHLIKSLGNLNILPVSLDMAISDTSVHPVIILERKLRPAKLSVHLKHMCASPGRSQCMKSWCWYRALGWDIPAPLLMPAISHNNPNILAVSVDVAILDEFLTSAASCHPLNVIEIKTSLLPCWEMFSTYMIIIGCPALVCRLSTYICASSAPMSGSTPSHGPRTACVLMRAHYIRLAYIAQ